MLNIPTTLRCREILLKKLSYAVMSSVVSQIIMLVVFVLIWNVNIFHPLIWSQDAVKTLTSFSTLFFVVPFTALTFAQSVICAKDYVVCMNYALTRFQKILLIFSVNNIFLLTLHAATGGLIAWLYITISNGEFQNFITECDDGKCLMQGSIFLITNGLFCGVYYFASVCRMDKNLQFPVVQQRKIYQLKSEIVSLITESRIVSFWPTLYFWMCYYIWGEYLQTWVVQSYGLKDIHYSNNIILYLYAWFFNTLYLFSMKLMRFFFILYLTEPIEFPLVSTSSAELKLQEAINMNNLPIIQNLACLDLYVLSYWTPLRRQVLFTLSQPGGHPHNWDGLVQNALKLFAEYTDLTNKSVDMILPSEKPKEEPKKIPVMLPPTSPYNYSNLRNMSLNLTEPLNIINVSHNDVLIKSSHLGTAISRNFNDKLNAFVLSMKRKLGYNYLFDELPEAYIKKCLGYGQLIIWTTQGLAALTAAAIEEDRYGIVQKDLPVLLTALLGLKLCLDKLNKVPVFTKRVVGSDNFNYKMKLALTSAVKRSLVNICKTYAEYLKDLPLNRDTLQQLQCYIPANQM